MERGPASRASMPKVGDAARQREWRGRSITQRMSLVTLAPQKLMNERRGGRSLLAAQIPLGASLLLFLTSSLMQQKALALSW